MNNKTLKKKKSCRGWKSLRKKLLEKRKVARKVAGIKLLDSPRTDNIPKSLINLTLDTCTRKRSFFFPLSQASKRTLLVAKTKRSVSLENFRPIHFFCWGQHGGSSVAERRSDSTDCYASLLSHDDYITKEYTGTTILSILRVFSSYPVHWNSVSFLIAPSLMISHNCNFAFLKN